MTGEPLIKPRPEVSILVPVRNEEATIGEVVTRLLALPLPPFEVIVIDDGSIDDTPKILDTFEEKIVVLRNEGLHGKGFAIRKGLEHVRHAG